MDLSQYKHIRSKKFPLPPSKIQQPSSILASQKLINRIALVASQPTQAYQIHQQNDDSSTLILFNQHQYLQRAFNFVYRLKQSSNQDIVVKIMGELQKQVTDRSNNLFIFNALDLTPIQELIFPWREHAKLKSNESSDKSTPQSVMRTIIQAVLKNKRSNTVVTLSILGIYADGSIEDQLNYQWIEQSKYIQDLLKIKQKTKLKVKKYKQDVKTFDLNRQKIKQWQQAQQILFHYSQIKQYLHYWKSELKSKQSPKVGQIYEVCQIVVDQQLGRIKSTEKRKILLKINQFMQESNLIITKVSQLLKQRAKGVRSISVRDNQAIMFLKDCFEKDESYSYTLLTQLGTNQSLKQQVICLNMDLQIPAPYLYLKNYCDKPEIMAQVKQLATNFNPLTAQQRSQIKIQSTQNGIAKLKPKVKSMIKQSEAITNKLFYFDTFSSNEKKRSIYGNSNTGFNQLQYNDFGEGKSIRFGPYSELQNRIEDQKAYL